MKWTLCAVKDEVIKQFGVATMHYNVEAGLRDFHGFIDNLGNGQKFAADYTFYKLGTYDSDTGIIDSDISILMLGTEAVIKGEK